MAVAVGFEPTEACTSHAFEACSLGRSDTPPRASLPDGHALSGLPNPFAGRSRRGWRGASIDEELL